MAGLMRAALAAGLLAILSMQAASAYDGSWAERRSGGGRLAGTEGPAVVHARFKASSACDYIASATQAAPAGVDVPRIAVPVTYVVARDGSCTNPSRVLKHFRMVFPGSTQYDVVLYFVTPEGRLLKRERIAINSH